MNKKEANEMVVEKLTVESLHRSLNGNGYICNHSFSAQLVTAVKSKPVGGAFLYGMAGTGKSYLPQVLSQVLDHPLYAYQCTQTTQPEDLLVKPMPDDTKISGIDVLPGVLLKASRESHEHPVMVMLDEWDKTRPSADGFFLDFLQYGRLSIPGMDVEANLDNMLIFITANDEREFHEALLRRFPKIDVQPLKPHDVVRALSITHDSHPYMSQMIDLYCRSIAGNLPKPATIQELRQLMDAIDELGDGADWDTLVYQYVTKTPENHHLLSGTAKVEDGEFDSRVVKRNDVIKAESYGVDITSKGDMDNVVSKMPSIRDFDTSFVTQRDEVKMGKVYAVFQRTERIDNLALQMNMDKADPDEPAFTDWSTITDDVVYLHEPTRSINATWVSQMLSHNDADDLEGEVVFTDRYITRKELNRMLARKWYVHKRSKNEIIARQYIHHVKVDLRWIEGKGIEIVADAKTAGAMRRIFKFNKSENLVANERYDKARNRSLIEPIGMFDVTRLLAGAIHHVINMREYRMFGPSQIKALSEHNAYCDMTVLRSPHGSLDGVSDDEIDMQVMADCMAINVCNLKDKRSVEFTAKNVEVALSDKRGANNTKYLRIDGNIKGNVASAILSWFECVPIYRCFKFEPGLQDKLLRVGWKVHQQNFHCFTKNNVYARFVYDYVVFVTFVKVQESGRGDMDNASLAVLFRSKIKRIDQLERAYDPNKK